MTDGADCTLTATGDLMFHGAMAERMRAGADMQWGFRPVAKALRNGDVLFGNLETPITANRRREPDAPGLYFSMPGTGPALGTLGYAVVNLAHNHIYDFGVEGVESTLRELAESNVAAIGIGRTAEEAARPAVITTKNGTRLGFLGYTTMCTALDRRHQYVACFPAHKRVERDIARLKPGVDAVVVSCHTGAQLNPYPAPETRRLAHAAVAAGASVFLGHHPHVPQGWERIGSGLAVYSLGDFVGPPQGEPARARFFIRVRLCGAEVIGHELVPCILNDAGQTCLAEGDDAAQIRDRIAGLTDAISDGSSDRLHFRLAGRRFFTQYLSSWREEIRVGGFRVLWRKARALRAYHLELVWRTVLDALAPKRLHRK